MTIKILRHLAACLFLGASASFAAPAKLMVLTGQNNHDWRAALPVLEDIVKQAGPFDVRVITSPPATATPEEQKAFDPDFAAFDVVVMHWNDYGVKNPVLPPWMDKLIAYVANGGGLVVHHAAGLEYHPGFGEVVGLVWQKPGFGERVTLDDAGGIVRVAKGEGPGSGHGARFEYPVRMWAKDHPICAGIPAIWRHTEDEAWFGQRGPAQDMMILATACPPETGLNEPMIWVRRHGQGRVFVCRLGHDAKAMSCVGFRTVFTRGCEWAATGKVTLPVPAVFPTPDATAVTGQ